MEEQIQKIKSWLGAGSLNIFGVPFAGKDTQGRILADMFGAELIGGGDILRHYPDQEKIKQLMSTGDLFPTDFYLSVVLPFLSRVELNGKPLILSSVGRMHGEEATVLEASRQSGHPIKAAIMLQLSEDEVWHRFDVSQQTHDRGNRADDTRQALEKRLQEFREKTVPVIDYYQSQGLLITIDGSQFEEDVTASIMDMLHHLAVRV